MVTQFFDLGTASNGLGSWKRPTIQYTDRNSSDPTSVIATPVDLYTKSPGIGPFMGGYGFGIRSTLLGYFLKLDAGWPMEGFFKGSPKWYFSLGFDF